MKRFEVIVSGEWKFFSQEGVREVTDTFCFNPVLLFDFLKLYSCITWPTKFTNTKHIPSPHSSLFLQGVRA